MWFAMISWVVSSTWGLFSASHPQQIQTILEISTKSPQTTILVAFVIFPVPNPISKAFLIISSSTCPSQVDTSSISSISWRKCWWHPEKYRRVRDREDRAPGDRLRVWKTWRRPQQADASRRSSSNIKMSWRKWRKWMGADGIWWGPEIRRPKDSIFNSWIMDTSIAFLIAG